MGGWVARWFSACGLRKEELLPASLLLFSTGLAFFGWVFFGDRLVFDGFRFSLTECSILKLMLLLLKWHCHWFAKELQSVVMDTSLQRFRLSAWSLLYIYKQDCSISLSKYFWGDRRINVIILRQKCWERCANILDEKTRSPNVARVRPIQRVSYGKREKEKMI